MVSSKEVMQSGIFDFGVYPVGKDKISSLRGHHKKGLLVALAGEERPEWTDFLEKILQAVGFDLEQDALRFWVTPGAPFWLKGLEQSSRTTHVIFFGIPPDQAGINVDAPLHTPLTIGGTTFLFAASLAEIQENPALKRPLWEALKLMFN